MLNRLILHANDVPSAIGLLDGKMGIALVLAHYARCRGKKKLEHAADFLVESVMNLLTKTVSIDFANGLSGIGWGIEYLIHKSGKTKCARFEKRNVQKSGKTKRAKNFAHTTL